MPRYINPATGKAHFSEKELSPDELEELFALDTPVSKQVVATPPVVTPVVEPEIEEDIPEIPKETSIFDAIPQPIRKFWGDINTPMVNAGPPQEARAMFEEENPILGGGIGFITDILSSLTSPLNVATGGLFGASRTIAGKLPQIAKGLHNIGRGTSIPVAAEGAYSAYEGDTLPEQIGGGIQAILGGLGIRAKMPRVNTKIPLGSAPKTEGNITFATKAEADLARPQEFMPDITKPKEKSINLYRGQYMKYNEMKSVDELSKLPKVLGEITSENDRKIIDNLKENILRRQQLDEPIELRRNIDGTLDVSNGRHRIVALQELGIEEVPVVYRNQRGGALESAISKPLPDITKPKNITNIGGDIVDTNTGEVINDILKIPEKPRVAPVKPNSPNFVLKNTTPETVKQLNEQGYVSTGRADKDGNPIFRKEKIEIQEESRTRQWYNLARGMMSVDAPFTTSAAFRQGLPWIGTRHWFNAYGKAVKSFGSEEIFKTVEDKIKKLPIFEKTELSTVPGKLKPSVAEDMGIKLVDASDVARGEAGQLRSNLAEKIPVYGRYVRASNRAYATFLNDLRANVAQSLYDDYLAINPNTISKGSIPPETLKQLGEFINTSTGLGKLSVEIGTKNYNKTLDFEKNAKLLSDVFFSPRLMARNIRMLNPSTYAMAEPFVRKQYMYATIRAMTAWWTMAGLAELAGASVSKDSTSSDFGKIKIGNTRLDPGGGLQQYLVLSSRYANQGTTPSSGKNEAKFKPFGTGFPQEDMLSTTTEFGINKLHPVAKFAADLMRASKYPVNLGDRTVQMALPLFMQDISEIIQKHPELAPLVIGASSLGIGSQTYGGGKEKSSFIPEEFDITIGGKKK